MPDTHTTDQTALAANLRRRVEERAICDGSLTVLVPLAELRAVLRALDAECDGEAQPCDACRGWGTIRPAGGCPCGCDDVDCSECDGTGEKTNACPSPRPDRL